MADNDTHASPSEATSHEPAGSPGAPSSPNSDASATAAVTAPATPSHGGPAAESGAGDASSGDDADGGDDSAGGDGDDGDDAGGGEEGASADGAAGGEGGPKKRKRRRRKKKGGTSAGTEAAPTEGGDDATRVQQPRKPQAPRKDPSQVPFGRYFEGAPGSRRNAFSIGEVVAGRVTRTEYGTILVDLFGKAIAVVDEHEPREVQMPPPAPEAPATEAAAAEPGAVEASSDAVPDAPVGGDVAAASDAPTETAVEATRAESAGLDAAGTDATTAEVDHDDGGGDHEDAGTLAAPSAPEEPPPPLPSIGEIFRGRVGAVAESGHLAIVNRLLDLKAARKRVDQAREDRTRVLGIVYGFNRGGFDVLVDGLRAFCPASGMALGPVDDPAEYVGRKLEFSVPPAKTGTHGLVVSRRAILEREARKQARERAKTLQLGERVRGVVTQVRDFGLFIDIGGGLEGMVHVSEMSWDRTQAPDISLTWTRRRRSATSASASP